MRIVIAVLDFSFIIHLFLLELGVNEIFDEMRGQLEIAHHIHHAYFNLIFDVWILDFLNDQHFLIYFCEELQSIAEAKFTRAEYV